MVFEFIEALYAEILLWVAMAILLCAIIIGLLIFFGCCTTIYCCCRKPPPTTAVVPIEVVMVPIGTVELAQPEPTNDAPPAYDKL